MQDAHDQQQGRFTITCESIIISKQVVFKNLLQYVIRYLL